MSLQTVPTTPTPTSSSQLQQQQQQQLQHQHQHQHEIAIFWDLLNVPLPTGMSASSTAKAIVDAVSSYGRIIDRRLYCDFTTATATTTTTTITTTADASASSTSASSPSSASNTNTAHSSSSSNNNNHQQQQHSLFLQDAGGFDLVPTTRRRHQDKRLMADIWTFCWDSSARKGNPCVVLLTNDGDYAYMLTKLRDRGVMTIVMIGQNDIGAWAILRDAADVALSLEQDVLPATATATSTLRTTDTIACNGSMLSSPPAITTTFSDTTTTTDRNSISADLLVLDLCRLVRNAQLAQEASPDNPYTDEWVDFGSVASYLQQIVSKNNLSGGENVKEFTKDIRKKAESKGYVQVGRRIINNNKDRSSPHAAAAANNKRKIVASFKNPKFSYSTEVYIRLLPAGMIALTEHQQQHEHDHKRSSSSSSPTKAAAGSPPNNNSKKSCCVYFRQLPINIRVVDLVQFVEETYDVTVLRALLESPGQNARSCHVEFTDPNHATLMLQKAKKAGGGEGMIFRGRYIGVVPNSRASALNKKGNEVVYYERMVSTAVVSSKSSDNTFRQNDTNHNKDNTTNNNNDTVNDTALLCQSILDLDSSQQEQYHTGSSVAWIGGGAVGQLFRVKLPDHVLEISTKDEVSTRFRTARDTAITNGLVEMGRRKMDSAVTATSSAISGTTASSSSSAGEYVVVPLTKPYSTNAATDATARLSKETYLRLLPEGRALALSRKQEAPLQVGANSHDESTPEKSSAGNVNATVRQCVFLNNVADSTGATQLAEFFETTVEGIQVDRIELEPSNWKGSICFAAHIQFSSPQQAKAVLAYSKATGLIHRGRRLYAAPDRTTPDIVAENKIERPTEMSYTRDLAKVKKLEPIAKPNSFFLSAQDNVIFGNISFDGSNSINSNDHAADLVSGLLGPSKTEEPKDPFEDLLWS